MGNQKKKKSNDVVIDVELFSELVIQVGTLKEIYDKIAINKDMNVFQKKVLLKNKEKNLDILKQLETAIVTNGVSDVVTVLM